MAMSATCSRVATASRAFQPAQTVVSRGFATEKQILLRITATQNLKKVSTAQRGGEKARGMGEGFREGGIAPER